MTPRVLVVDDDTALAEMIGIVLRTEGFEPAFCADGAGALAAFRETRPDLVLLDLMLPGVDGIEVCGRIRAESGTPIIMLTAKGDTADVVRGLESGADDYMVKPFAAPELAARVRALLRRSQAHAGPRIVHGPLVLDTVARRAFLRDAPLELAARRHERAAIQMQHLVPASSQLAAQLHLKRMPDIVVDDDFHWQCET